MVYPNAKYLVETEWLQQNLGDENLRIFDVTGMLTPQLENVAKAKVYDRGHIPGAAYLDVASPKGMLSDPSAVLPWTWPTASQFEHTMESMGVSKHSKVVVYASSARKGVDNGSMWSTRAWWLMHHFGVDCALLNGSFEKWTSEGRPVSTTPHTYPATKFKADSNWQRGLATKGDVLSALDAGSTCIVDALSTASYMGKGDMVYGPKKGHISGAVNVPMYSLVDEDTGTFISEAQMRALFEDAGVLSSNRVITYCGGAIAATVDAFALMLLGHTDVSVYDGSLLEWASDPSLPMTDPTNA